MSILFNRPKAPSVNTQNSQPLNHIKVTQSVIGNAIPIVLGKMRVPSFLLWSKDFKAIGHQDQSANAGGGGKGLGGGNSNAGDTTVTYTYQTAVLAGLCQGPIDGVVNVWDTKGTFQQVSATENFTIPVGGGTYQVANHTNFGNDHGVGIPRAYSQPINDFGAPAPTTLAGSFQVPLESVASSPVSGQYVINPTTGQYTFSAADAGSVASITYSYDLAVIQTEEQTIVPTTPFQITVSDSTDYIGDAGVFYSPSGTPLQIVNGTPTVGQYNALGAGLYQFAAADVGREIVINYKVNNTLGKDAPTALSYTLFLGQASQAPWSYLTTNHSGEDFGYTQIAYIASENFQLDSSGAMPNYTYEVLNTTFSHGAGIVDCNPADNIRALLIDPVIGTKGFPAARIGDWTNAEAFWAANNFFITTYLPNQVAVSSEVGSYLEAGMTSAFWSEGLLKLKPFGDTSAAGNGFIYIAQNAPVADLGDDDFASAQGSDPVKVGRSPAQDAYNRVQVEWLNRVNAYNTEITYEQDDAAINSIGALRIESPMSWHFITTLAAAQFAANLRLKRSVYVRNNYTFKLKGSNWSHLEPMDLVTITVSSIGLIKTPIRITKVEDDGANGTTITAEDFPWGTAQPTLYPKATNDPAYPTAGLADPGNTNLVIFETPNRYSQQQGNILNIAAGPKNNNNWASCNLWISLNGTDYDFFGNIPQASRIGTLANALQPGAADPDTSTLTVNLGQAATLPDFSLDDFNQNIPLCALLNTSAAVPVTLTYNVPVFSTDGTAFTALTGFANSNIKLSATILGTSQQPDDVVFNLGPPSGNNGVTNATITLPSANFQAIQIFGGGVGSTAGFTNQIFLVNYVDFPVNGNFETSSALPPVGWDTFTATPAYDTATPHAGTRSLRITFPSQFTACSSHEKFPVRAGDVYKISAWIKGDNGTNIYEVQHAFFNASGTYLGGGSQAALSSSTSWTAVSSTDTVPAGAVYSQIFLQSNSVGVTIGEFDDISVQQVFTQSQSDWSTPKNFAGENIGLTMNYNTLNTGTINWQTGCIYKYVFNVNPAKVLSSLVMPANGNSFILGVTCVNNGLELLSYQNGTLIAPNQYQLTPLHRGLFDTPNVSHVTGETFVRIDNAVAQKQFDSSYYGKQIFIKATSINALGGREQALTDVTPYSFIFRGTGPGGIDTGLGTIAGGKGSIPNTWTGSLGFSTTASSVSFNYAITVNRAALPKPYQVSSRLDSTFYSGTFTVSGLNASTTYYFYPYIDDSVPGGAFKLAIIGGGIGTPPAAFLTQTAQATFLQGRSDHIPLSNVPISVTTAPAGGTGGGSGGGTAGTCPRGDMVVFRKTETGEEIVACRYLVAGDYIKDQRGWVKVVRATHKMMNQWIEISTDCGETVVVTPRHLWPLNGGSEKKTCLLNTEDVLLSSTGRAFITCIRVIREEALCIGLEVESGDHLYYIGSKVPRLLTHNNQPDIT